MFRPVGTQMQMHSQPLTQRLAEEAITSTGREVEREREWMREPGFGSGLNSDGSVKMSTRGQLQPQQQQVFSGVGLGVAGEKCYDYCCYRNHYRYHIVVSDIDNWLI